MILSGILSPSGLTMEEIPTPVESPAQEVSPTTGEGLANGAEETVPSHVQDESYATPSRGSGIDGIDMDNEEPGKQFPKRLS